MSAMLQDIAVTLLVTASLLWCLRGLHRFLRGDACDCRHCPHTRSL